MIKAFISHSSKQKEFALKLVECLGRDLCIIDCFDFQPAYQTEDQICQQIKNASAFVLLLSKDALQSKWVQEEVKIAIEKMSDDDLSRFWPYIVDDLDVNDCPKWISRNKCFNLVHFSSPKLLSIDINQKIRKLIWSANPAQEILDTMLIGRAKDIDSFEKKFYASVDNNIKSLVVCGRAGVGKEAFTTECIRRSNGIKEYAPSKISLQPAESVEDFISYLNSYTFSYKNEESSNIFSKSIYEKVDIAVDMLNSLYNAHSVLLIEDDYCLITYKGDFATWFIDIVTNEHLTKKLGIFIMSKHMPKVINITSFPQIIVVPLQEIDREDRKKILVQCLRLYGVQNMSSDDINYFIDKLLHSPYQLIKVAEAVSVTSVELVKANIKDYVEIGDNKMQTLLGQFLDRTESKNVLIILSEFDVISYEIVEEIFQGEYTEALTEINKMMSLGIVSRFGKNEQYLRLDHYVSDYIRRCRIKLDDVWQNSVIEVIEKSVRDVEKLTEDTSLYLYNIKKQILSNKSFDSKYLFPSIIVKTLMEKYNNQDYKFVIQLGYDVLNSERNYYPEIKREIRYWLCLSLCRVQDNRFYEEVKPMENADLYFLKGFYKRIETDYQVAESLYRRALKMSPNLQRAKRELVTVLSAQNKYSEALTLAQENYERNPENSYQIYGYFRCLVRKYPLTYDDKKQLEELMSKMNENYSEKREELYSAMKIEYNSYVLRLNPNAMLDIIDKAKNEFPKSANVLRAAESYLYKQGIKKNMQSFEEDCDF